MIEVIKELEILCQSCDLYNSLGCVNRKGEIVCKVREEIIRYKTRNNLELPYNWRRTQKAIKGLETR